MAKIKTIYLSCKKCKVNRVVTSNVKYREVIENQFKNEHKNCEKGGDKMLGRILDIGGGYKTYVVGVAMILYALSGFILDNVSQEVAIASLMAGVGLLTGRRASQR